MAADDKQKNTLEFSVSMRTIQLVIAFVFLRIWDYWVLMRFSYIQSQELWVFHPYVLATVLLLSIAISAPKFLLKTKSWFSWLIAGIATFLCIALFIFEHEEHIANALFFATGFCTAALWFICLITLVTLPEKTAFAGILIGSIAVSILQLFLSLLPIEVSTWIAIFFPLAAVACLEYRKPTIIFERERVLYFSQHHGFKTLARIFVCLCILMFVYSFMNAFLKAEFGSYAFSTTPISAVSLAGHGLTLAIFTFMTFFTLKHKRPIDLTLLLVIPELLLASAILIVVLLPVSPFVQILTFTSISLLIPSSWLITIDAIRHSDASPVRLGAIGIMSYFLSSLLGTIAYQLISPLNITITLGSSETFAVLCLVVMLLLLAVRPEDRQARSVLSTTGDGNQPVLETLDFDERLAVLARIHDLTEREVTVTRLFALGKSKAAIAQELCVSENTVKTYIKRIYTKLDVHNRDDLLQLLEL